VSKSHEWQRQGGRIVNTERTTSGSGAIQYRPLGAAPHRKRRFSHLLSRRVFGNRARNEARAKKKRVQAAPLELGELSEWVDQHGVFSVPDHAVLSGSCARCGLTTTDAPKERAIVRHSRWGHGPDCIFSDGVLHCVSYRVDRDRSRHFACQARLHKFCDVRGVR
jgi:hypothetical protein